MVLIVVLVITSIPAKAQSPKQQGQKDGFMIGWLFGGGLLGMAAGIWYALTTDNTTETKN